MWLITAGHRQAAFFTVAPSHLANPVFGEVVVALRSLELALP